MSDLLLGLAVIVISALLSLSINRSIRRPLDRLTRELGKLSTGDHELSLPVERKDEIGNLVQCPSKGCTTVNEEAIMVNNENSWPFGGMKKG